MKEQNSPLVESVIALDRHFNDLERLSSQIEKLDLESEFGLAQARRLMGRFAESSQGVSIEVTQLSARLNEARVRAESVAEKVAGHAAILEQRSSEEQSKFVAFQKLGERVRSLSTAMNELKRSPGEVLSAEEKAQLTQRLAGFESEIEPLILEAQELRQSAREAKMKSLEQQADSLTQTLQAVRSKLSSIA